MKRKRNKPTRSPNAKGGKGQGAAKVPISPSRRWMFRLLAKASKRNIQRRLGEIGTLAAPCPLPPFAFGDRVGLLRLRFMAVVNYSTKPKSPCPNATHNPG